MNEEDEAFNEIERRSVAKKEAVRAAIDMREELTKALIESYDAGVKDALEAVIEGIKEQDYKKPWVGLTDEEIWTVLQFRGYNTDTIEIAKAIEAKLKEKNT